MSGFCQKGCAKKAAQERNFYFDVGPGGLHASVEPRPRAEPDAQYYSSKSCFNLEVYTGQSLPLRSAKLHKTFYP